MLLGVSIWMAVDRNFMTIIIGNNLYAAAVFIVLGGGGIIFFVSFLGCCGVVKEQLFMLFVVSIAVFNPRIHLILVCVRNSFKLYVICITS